MEDIVVSQEKAQDDTDRHIDFIWTTVEKLQVGMLTTRAGSDMRGRPMTAIARRDENRIWFLSDAETHKEAELRQDPRACVLFADPKEHTYVSLSGEVEISRDRDLIKSFWNVAVDTYFPQGPDDPSVILIGFQPEQGEFWDAPSNPLVLAIRFVQAKLTNERPDLGENAKVTLQ